MKAFLFITLVVFVLTCTALAKVRYTVTDLGTLPEGTYSYANAINSNGQVVGYADTNSGSRHAFLYSNGVMSDLGSLGGDSYAKAINDSGQVVGYYIYVDTGFPHAFLYSGGTMTDIGFLCEGHWIDGGVYVGSYSVATGINSNSQIVGYSQDCNGNGHYFLYNSGVMTDLGINGGAVGGPGLINDNGQIAGTIDNGDHTSSPFIYNDGLITVITTSTYYTQATAINSSGHVGGYFVSNLGNNHPFLYSDGVLTDLYPNTGLVSWAVLGINDMSQLVGNEWWSVSTAVLYYSNGGYNFLNDLIAPTSGWDLKQASAINNAGQIVGYGTNAAGQTHAFLLTSITYSGGNGTQTDPYRITDVNDWQKLMNTSADWNKYFILASDVNLTGVTLTPVGNDSIPFSGIFDGQRFVLRNAVINQPANSNIGIFGVLAGGGQVRNLGVENVNITGQDGVGGLVGAGSQFSDWIITSCYSTGAVSGSAYTGGLIGYSGAGSIVSCYSTISVSGVSYVGGLVGNNGFSSITSFPIQFLIISFLAIRAH